MSGSMPIPRASRRRFPDAAAMQQKFLTLGAPGAQRPRPISWRMPSLSLERYDRVEDGDASRTTIERRKRHDQADHFSRELQ